MKQNQTSLRAKQPKNIGYRVIMAILAICVPIVTYFSDLIYMVWDSEVFKFIAQLQGNTADNGQTEQSLSFQYVVQELIPTFQNSGQTNANSIWQALAPIHTELICCAVCLALAVLLAVAIFFVSAFCRNRTAGTVLAGVGLLSVIGLAISFHYLSLPLFAGEITIASFLPNSLTATILASAAKLSVFQLSTGFYLMLFLFIAMALWGIANWLVALGDKKTKKEA